jgi:hypothetical protein
MIFFFEISAPIVFHRQISGRGGLTPGNPGRLPFHIVTN